MIPSIKNNYLVEACRKGDPGAQLQVYKQYFMQMFNISFKLVNNADAADEIVNESFLVVFDKISAYKGQTDMITLIMKQVENRSVQTWRRNNVAYPGLVTDRILVK